MKKNKHQTIANETVKNNKTSLAIHPLGREKVEYFLKNISSIYTFVRST